jgi:hypothetical protein
MRAGLSPVPLLIAGSVEYLVELRDLTLPKRAICKAGMWNRKRRGVHDAIVEPDNVEIECSRAPLCRAITPCRGFDAMEMIEQRVGLERCLDGQHLIQIGRLLEATKWLGFIHARLAYDATVGDGGDGLAGMSKKAKPIADV